MPEDKKCSVHSAHVLRFEVLEENMEKLTKVVETLVAGQRDPKILLALLAVLTTSLSAIGSFCGGMLIVYLKVRGYII